MGVNMIKFINSIIYKLSPKRRLKILKEIQERVNLAGAISSMAIVVSQLAKCAKCKHKFEEIEPFGTGGIVVKKDKEEIVLPDINIYGQGDN